MFSTTKYDLLFLCSFNLSVYPQKTNEALEAGFEGGGTLLKLSG
jgi:hypothetical protein